MDKRYFIGGGFNAWFLRALLVYCVFAACANFGSIVRGEHLAGSTIFLIIFGALVYWNLRTLKRLIANDERTSSEPRARWGEKLTSLKETSRSRDSARVTRMSELEEELHATRRKREDYYHRGNLTLADQAQMDQLSAHEDYLARELKKLHES